MTDQQGRVCNLLQARMIYPSCWDGVNLDSPNHRDHMTYALGPTFAQVCPDSHPVAVPTLQLEALFPLGSLTKQLGRTPVNSDFILSTGDTTGAGMHSDFLSGWDEPFLKQQLATCNFPTLNAAGCQLQMRSPIPAVVPATPMLGDELTYLQTPPGM
jgi:hypothetical protein